ncbi:ADP-ribose pyrophosphatase [Enhydrobacter aerosaccus]|uniref:ADP-ribose pyrophosphatase n=1 Tax=Enhydrobacter aerosaccus TaxID=225324 RepID=A0A1T4L568_9HYPH|nr:NUDIX domain-containing protein [Enhydrobacter aerosaccus]SJZ49824.1 ADP-ribose pyrophosphatase [Enhydrobacter aerosaccus]
MNQSELPNETVEVVRKEVAFQGYFKVIRYFFRHGLHQGGQSKVISREVFERGQAGAVLPYDPKRDEVVLIRQFRAGAFVAGHHPFTWETVAGMLEDGETAEAMVRREAVEEADLAITDVWPIQNMMLTPGACSEACRLFLGRADTTNAGGIFGLETEDENIFVKVLPFSEALAMVERNEVDNAVSVVALLWLALHREEVRERWS